MRDEGSGRSLIALNRENLLSPMSGVALRSIPMELFEAIPRLLVICVQSWNQPEVTGFWVKAIRKEFDGSEPRMLEWLVLKYPANSPDETVAVSFVFSEQEVVEHVTIRYLWSKWVRLSFVSTFILEIRVSNFNGVLNSIPPLLMSAPGGM